MGTRIIRILNLNQKPDTITKLSQKLHLEIPKVVVAHKKTLKFCLFKHLKLQQSIRAILANLILVNMKNLHLYYGIPQRDCSMRSSNSVFA